MEGLLKSGSDTDSKNSSKECVDENKTETAPHVPNSSVVANHYNQVNDVARPDRFQSKIFYMRNFNNWIKGELIDEYITRIRDHKVFGAPFRVLDLCSGKGGDLLKWEKANITHLICTDIAELAVEQSKQRYNNICQRRTNVKYGSVFKAEFIVCDSSLVRLREHYHDPSIKFDLVSCQFAFHYSFESLSQANCMVRNAAECLQPGGYFIATMPNANEIMRRLRASSTKSFGNRIYNIEFQCETDPPPLFGAKYLFHLEGVVDCPEFLVHFPTMVKLCRKHGLELERKQTFAEYYEESIQKGRQLLQRMKGLETVYYDKRGDEEYQHISTAGEQISTNKPIGTLSKSEWEAITLYLVCAFKKVKTS